MMRNSLSDDIRPRKGIVLIVVLAVITFVTLICYRFADQMTLEREAASLAVRESQARQWAKSGVDYTLALLSDPLFDKSLTYDDPELFAEQWVNNADGSGPAGMWSVVVPPDPILGFPARYGLQREGGKINLNALVETELTEEEQRDILMAIPNMTETLADMVLDYLDSDSTSRDFGSETDEEGYFLKNAPITSLDDLLNIPGVTLEILYGEDANHNDTLDANENDGDLRWPTDNADGMLNYGWDYYLTLWSAESNLREDLTAKIDLNQTSVATLYEALVEEVTEDVAEYIVAYRIYGPVSTTSETSGSTGSAGSGSSGSGSSSNGGSNSSGGGGNTGGGGSGQSGSGGRGSGGGSTGGGSTGGGGTGTSSGSGSSGGVSTTTGGSSSSGVNTVTAGNGSSSGVNTVTSNGGGGSGQGGSSGGSSMSGGSGGGSATTSNGVDLSQQPQFEITTIFELFDSQVKFNVDQVQMTLASPMVSSDLDQVALIEEAASISPEPKIPGRIDINYAAREVLMGLPEMTDLIADTIVTNQGQWITTGELVANGTATIEQLRKLDQFLTTSSSTFRMQSVGYSETSDQSVRVDAVIDASGETPVLLWMRDLSVQGRAFDPLILKPISNPVE